MSLEGSVVFVSGGTGIVGHCAALACLEEGAKVWISGRKKESLEAIRNQLPEKFHCKFGFVVADFNKEDEAIKVRDEILRVDGKVNHVISSIGAWELHGKLSDVEVATYLQSMHDRTVAHFICYRTFAKCLANTPKSSFIFVTGGSCDESIPFHVPEASMLPPTTAAVYGLHAAAACEMKDNSNVAIIQIRIFFMITREKDSTYDHKTSQFQVGNDFVGKFFPKMMVKHENGALYKLKSRDDAKNVYSSLNCD